MTDAIVIGAGHNGLVCATYLAQRGLAVTVVEAAGEVGGACVTREFAPGFRVSTCAHLARLFDISIERELDLGRHGLVWAATGLPTVALDREGSTRRIDGDRVEGRDLPQADVERYRAFHRRITQYTRVLAHAARRTPPRRVEGGWRVRIALAGLALRLRLLGRDDMRDLLRIGAINIHDVLEEEFEDERLKGALSLDGVLGAWLGPRSPNSVLGYLHNNLALAWGQSGAALPTGGMGAITAALARAATVAGATVRTDTSVGRILTDAGRATGVRLANGEEISAPIVASSADPHTTFAGLVGYAALETGFVRRIEHHRSRGTAAKLHLALDEPPRFNGLEARDLGARLVIAPALGAVERAFDAVKYGECSTEPVLEISVPTAHDPGLAPRGKHVLSAIVQFVPLHPATPWPQLREPFIERLLVTLEAYAPGIRSSVIASDLLTPADIEARFGTFGGHWHHGELGFDQFMMMRPVPGAGHYATPVEGLYLCGAGAHPGGGVIGLAGCNAAREIHRMEGRPTKRGSTKRGSTKRVPTQRGREARS
jgi:phytoene dehydrogenase-like protein